MKKFKYWCHFFLLVGLLNFCTPPLQAQEPTAYEFQYSKKAYTPLTGGTSLGAKYAEDPNNSLLFHVMEGDTGYKQLAFAPYAFTKGITLPFTFSFCGEDFNSVAVLGNGYIMLGKDSVKAIGNRTPSANSNINNAIGLAYQGAVHLQKGVSDISYLLNGLAAERTLTIQFNKVLVNPDFDPASGMLATEVVWDTISFQICLFEKDNHIEIAVKQAKAKYTILADSYSTPYFRAFIKKNSNATAVNVGTEGVDPITSSCISWSTGLTTSTMMNLPFTAQYSPDADMLYTFIPPKSCQKPAPAASLIFKKYTTSTLKGSITLSPNTDKYLVVQTTDPILTARPEDRKVYYKRGKIGNGTIVNIGVPLSGYEMYDVSVSNLKPDSKYYFHVFAFNDACMGGPIYSDSLTVSAITSPDAPNLSLVEANRKDVKLHANYKDNSLKVVLGRSLIAKDESTANKIELSGVVKVGDQIQKESFLLEIVYVGSFGDISVANLEEATPYYFMAFTMRDDDTNNIQYSDPVKFNVRTLSTVPLKFNFDKDAVGAQYSMTLPAGWSVPEPNPVYPFKDYENDGFMFPTDDGSNFGLDQNVSQTPNRYMRVTLNVGLEFIRQIATGVSYGFWDESYYGSPMNNPIAQVCTPEFMTGIGEHKVTFEYAFSAQNLMPSERVVAYKFKTHDSILVQVGTKAKGYTDWKTIFVVDSVMGVSTDFVARTFSFKDYDTQSVKLRFVYKIEGYAQGALGRVYVDNILPCPRVDPPVLVGGSITAYQAEIKWIKPVGELEVKNYNYRIVNTETHEWSSILSTDSIHTKIYLQPNSIYQVQVQSVCANEQTGYWSELSKTITTVFDMPVHNDFSDPAWNAHKNFKADNFIHLRGWDEFNNGSILDGDVSTIINHTTNPGYWYVRSWRMPEDFSKTILLDDNLSISSSFTTEKHFGHWFLTPTVRLNKEIGDLTLHFTVSMTGETNRSSVTEADTNNIFAVVLSTDGGTTFRGADTLLRWGKGSNKPLELMDSVLVSLKIPADKIQGRSIRIGFFAQRDAASDPAHPHNLYIDDIRLDYSCPKVKDLKVDATDKTASISWSGSDSVVFRYKSELEKNYIYDTLKTSFYQLKNLQPSTNYEYGIYTICKNGISDWAIGSFRTLELNICDTVKNIFASNPTKSSVQLNWFGNAASYKIAWKVSDSSVWHEEKATTSPFTLKGLKVETDYNYKIQAICSAEDESFVSVYSGLYSFSTLPITCPKITDLTAYDTTYWSVKIKFTSDAPQFLVSIQDKTAATEPNLYLGESTNLEIPILLPERLYNITVQPICAVGDTGQISNAISVKTLSVPPCGAPSNLKTAEIFSDGALLTWSAGENNRYYNVFYKQASALMYDTGIIVPTSYRLSKLKPQTMYTWRVQGVCDEHLSSSVVNALSFSTAGVSLEDISKTTAAFKVYAESSVLNVINLFGLEINRIELINLSGQVIGTYSLSTKDNILLPLNVDKTILLVKVYTSYSAMVYKIYVN